ncbi:hypothetical protein PAPYR_12741 [Paratrimastix pyriformis]|uniref:Uncharacterized protein n=1 Tax=Paratrimastix pyriformis TaxID=342808 RepID=A0ABQ8U1D0_9EUKA|nr:hypothetical protein PAPYR_12741 [Paratrimastix pyriformis]
MGENQDRKQVEAAGQLHLNRKRFSGPIKNRIHWFVQLIVLVTAPTIGGAFVFWDPATVAHVGRVMPSRWFALDTGHPDSHNADAESPIRVVTTPGDLLGLLGRGFVFLAIPATEMTSPFGLEL